MALTFGSGEQVDRLRRGLDIKGRVVLGVDEIVVPTVNVGDFTVAPIRKSGIRWYAPLVIPAVAGELGRYRVFHQNPVDQLIDKIMLVADANMNILIGSGVVGAAGGIAARTTELVTLPLQGGAGGGQISRPIGIFTLADSNVGATVVNTLIITEIDTTVPTILDVGIVLPAVRDPAAPNFSTLTIEGQNANTLFRVTCSGLYFDTLPLNVTT